MAREHRSLDAVTGVLIIAPFTPEEEARADQREMDAAAKKAAESTPQARLDRAFPPTDNVAITKSLLLELLNRVAVLEGGASINKTGLEALMKTKLP